MLTASVGFVKQNLPPKTQNILFRKGQVCLKYVLFDENFFLFFKKAQAVYI